MQIVYRAANIIDANLVKNALDAEGIPAFVGGQYLTGAIGELPPMPPVSTAYISTTSMTSAKSSSKTKKRAKPKFHVLKP